MLSGPDEPVPLMLAVPIRRSTSTLEGRVKETQASTVSMPPPSEKPISPVTTSPGLSTM